MNKVIDELKAKMQAITDKESMNTNDLKFLEECLYNKWYGVQVMASKVLAKHHPQEAFALLKDWLLLHFDHYQMRTMAYRALGPCIRESDMAWILDLYLKHSTDRLLSYLLMDALSQFPNEYVIQVLMSKCKNQDNHDFIRVLAHVHKSQSKRVLKALLDNPKVPNKSNVKEWFRIASL